MKSSLHRDTVPFTMVPNAFINDGGETSVYDKAVYMYLAMRANADAVAWPSVARISSDLGMSRPTVY